LTTALLTVAVSTAASAAAAVGGVRGRPPVGRVEEPSKGEMRPDLEVDI